MEKTGQGYDLPLTVDPSGNIVFTCIGLIAMAGSAWFAVSEGNPGLLAVTGLFLALTLFCVGSLLARLQIVSGGIAITILGITVRRIPAERIRLIAGVHKPSGKGSPHDVMAVCTASLEELTALSAKHTPRMLKNSKERREGEWAGKYLCRRAQSLTGELNLQKSVLWLDWDIQRLEILRQMYPHARWLDVTEKKIFDAQRMKK